MEKVESIFKFYFRLILVAVIAADFVWIMWDLHRLKVINSVIELSTLDSASKTLLIEQDELLMILNKEELNMDKTLEEYNIDPDLLIKHSHRFIPDKKVIVIKILFLLYVLHIPVVWAVKVVNFTAKPE